MKKTAEKSEEKVFKTQKLKTCCGNTFINIVFHIFNICYSPAMFKHSIQQSVEKEQTFFMKIKNVEI